MKTCVVIVAAFNAEKWIGEMIQSYRELSPVDGWQYKLCIGVDGCNKTAELLDSMGVAYYRSDRNVGAYIMRNSMISEEFADMYAIFDADDIMRKNYLEQLIPLAEKTGIAASYKTVMGGMQTNGVMGYGGGICIFTREVWCTLGGFREDRIAADYDFVMRATLAGLHISISTEPLYTYRRHVDSLTGSPETSMLSDTRKAIMAQHDIDRMRGRLCVDPVVTKLHHIAEHHVKNTALVNRVSVIVFLPHDHEDRLRAWSHCRRYWESIGGEVIQARGDEQDYWKSAVAHDAARRAAGDILIFADADCLPDDRALWETLRAVASDEYDVGSPKTTTQRLSDTETAMAYRGTWTGRHFEISPYRAQDVGGIFIVSRAFWERTGGMDLRFRGWGGEDGAYGCVCRAMGRVYRSTATMWHFYHAPQASKRDMAYSTHERNNMLFRDYATAENSGNMAQFIEGRPMVDVSNYEVVYD